MDLLRNVKDRVIDLFSMYSGMAFDKMRYDAEARDLRMKTFSSNESGVSKDKVDGKELIVSLTSYSKRFYDVHTTIESIMQQSVKPNRIILWLQHDMRNMPLPLALKKQMNRGLDIRFCKDIKSYKKLIYTLREFPNDIIVTIDDDVIYRFDMLENMINSYLEAPEFIYGNRIKEIGIKNGNLMPYNTWKIVKEARKSSLRYMATGVGGVLYPPNKLDIEVLNEENFTTMCPTADDLWFKSMAIKAGTLYRTVNVHTPAYIENPLLQASALYNINVVQGCNDEQLEKVFKYYNLIEKIR